MNELKLGVIEEQFANIIWDNEPLTSGELVKMCDELLGWKKSTTYTVLKKLCERKLFRNTDGNVSSLISKEDFYSIQTQQFVEDTFDGSLLAFIASFTHRKRLTEQEISEIKELIDSMGE